MGYLLAKPYKYFRARQHKKRKARLDRQKQFRKGFVHKSSEPKQYEIKPELPGRGRKRRFF